MDGDAQIEMTLLNILCSTYKTKKENEYIFCKCHFVSYFDICIVKIVVNVGR
jgi:hypothetical protein